MNNPPALPQNPPSPPGDWIDMREVLASSAKRSSVPYEVRDYVSETDEGFFYKSYLKSYWRTAVRLKMIQGAAGEILSRDVYNAGQREVLDSILGHAGVLMACTPSDHWQTLGFVVFDDLPSGLVIHYVYVKKIFRKAGLGTELVLDLLDGRRGFVYTHFTAPCRFLIRSLKRQGVPSVYNPYLAK